MHYITSIIARDSSNLSEMFSCRSLLENYQLRRTQRGRVSWCVYCNVRNSRSSSSTLRQRCLRRTRRQQMKLSNHDTRLQRRYLGRKQATQATEVAVRPSRALGEAHRLARLRPIGFCWWPDRKIRSSSVIGRVSVQSIYYRSLVDCWRKSTYRGHPLT